ncbi:MFS transporter [Fodinicurvata sediminis]|uniref:MFS transporter n=1 Tax=Fodinicurvata sediminis TaxID=1121832 RepID=UPI0003B54B84|nr:MFS transporter [Fodinicurvata sediminis]
MSIARESTSGTGTTQGALDRLYAVVAGDDSLDRACDAIPDDACTQVPRNFFLNLFNGLCTKLAEQLVSPGLTLPWLLTAIGAPGALVGFLSPIKQVGSLVPQLFVAARIRQLGRRKWVWVSAGILQACCLLLMIPSVLLLSDWVAGLTVLALLTVFSVASGAGSVSFQDVLGKTIPKGRRGRLLAGRAALGGGLTLIAGLGLRVFVGEDAGAGPYVLLLLVSAGLWLIAAVFFAGIREAPGEQQGGRNAIAEARKGIALVRSVSGYRKYLNARAALTSVEVAMPLFVLHAYQQVPAGMSALSIFIVFVGLANIISSPFWGRLSDRTARQVMMLAAIMGGTSGVLALLLGWWAAETLSVFYYAPVFFLLGIAEAGARLGRKTYLVDAAPSEERPLYVAFANSAIGLVALALGGLGILADLWVPATAVIAFTVLAFLGGFLSYIMPEANRMVGQ